MTAGRAVTGFSEVRFEARSEVDDEFLVLEEKTSEARDERSSRIDKWLLCDTAAILMFTMKSTK